LTARIFKTKAFARLARKEIEDGDLIEAVDVAEKGLIDADLGGGVIKQRIARRGQGKSGGYRAILAFRSKTRSVFVYLFAKSSLANVQGSQMQSLQELAGYWLTASDELINKAIAAGEIIEVKRAKAGRET
jgi:hypothetical protein